jgi:hypothetical protein
LFCFQVSCFSETAYRYMEKTVPTRGQLRPIHLSQLRWHDIELKMTVLGNTETNEPNWCRSDKEQRRDQQLVDRVSGLFFQTYIPPSSCPDVLCAARFYTMNIRPIHGKAQFSNLRQVCVHESELRICCGFNYCFCRLVLAAVCVSAQVLPHFLHLFTSLFSVVPNGIATQSIIYSPRIHLPVAFWPVSLNRQEFILTLMCIGTCNVLLRLKWTPPLASMVRLRVPVSSEVTTEWSNEVIPLCSGHDFVLLCFLCLQRLCYTWRMSKDWMKFALATWKGLTGAVKDNGLCESIYF